MNFERLGSVIWGSYCLTTSRDEGDVSLTSYLRSGDSERDLEGVEVSEGF